MREIEREKKRLQLHLVKTSGCRPEPQYEAFPLSVDHNCYNPEEKKKTIARSGDRNAIRCSPQDIRAGLLITIKCIDYFVLFSKICLRAICGLGNSKAIPRVAGYLAVTRSLGDFYLKEQQHAKFVRVLDNTYY